MLPALRQLRVLAALRQLKAPFRTDSTYRFGLVLSLRLVALGARSLSFRLVELELSAGRTFASAGSLQSIGGLGW